MAKQTLSEEFRRMQKIAGIITEVKTDVEKSQKLDALVNFFRQGGTGNEMRAIRDTYLHFKNNKDIETLEPVLKNRYLKSPGIFNFDGFTEDEFKEIVEKLAEKKDDESFLEAPSFNVDENINDGELEKSINNLTSKDLHWSKDPENGLNIAYNFDDVDEELLITQLLNLIKKVNPNTDLEKKKISFSRDFAQFNDKLYSASQKSFSAEVGLKDYFKDNLYIFK